MTRVQRLSKSTYENKNVTDTKGEDIPRIDITLMSTRTLNTPQALANRNSILISSPFPTHLSIFPFDQQAVFSNLQPKKK